MVRRGEIWLADLGSGRGSQQAGVRPVIIISNDKNNEYSPTVNVIPLTTRKKRLLPVHVIVPTECGVPYESTALTEQEMTLDKISLKCKMGVCTTNVLTNVEKAVKIQKDIYKPFCITDFITYFGEITKYNDKNKIAKVLLDYCRSVNVDVIF